MYNAGRLTYIRFRLFPVRSPLLRESLLLSVPEVNKRFQFSSLAPLRLCIQRWVTRYDPRRVAPFGNPRIKACLPLPEAYRSLPRPSSPTGAKASIVRPYALDQTILTCPPRRIGADRFSAQVACPSLCSCQRTKSQDIFETRNFYQLKTQN